MSTVRKAVFGLSEDAKDILLLLSHHRKLPFYVDTNDILRVLLKTLELELYHLSVNTGLFPWLWNKEKQDLEFRLSISNFESDRDYPLARDLVLGLIKELGSAQLVRGRNRESLF